MTPKTYSHNNWATFSPWASLGGVTKNEDAVLFQRLCGKYPNPGTEPRSPALQVNSLSYEPRGKTNNTGVGSLSLLQGIFLTQELNPGSPTLQADSLPAKLTGKTLKKNTISKIHLFKNFPR